MITTWVFLASLTLGAADPCAQSTGNSHACIARAEQNARAGDSKAIKLLAEHYMRGPGADPGAAERWLREGAQQGDRDMALALGTLLLDSARTRAEQHEGKTLLGPLAEAGDVNAALRLAGHARAAGDTGDADYWAQRASDAAGNATGR